MILDNINKIRYRVRAAAQRSGRNPNDVSVIAVTKYAELASVRELLESGLVGEIAESRVQDAASRREALQAAAGKVRWRLIGHLQTNKAKKAVQVFDAIDSLDSLKLAEALERALPEGKILPVLVQVKITERETQSGVSPDALPALLKGLEALPRLEARGLMAIAPNLEPVEKTRPFFRSVKALFDRFFSAVPGAQLSMGMSRDFEVAVEEGATHVRVGSAIFS